MRPFVFCPFRWKKNRRPANEVTSYRGSTYVTIQILEAWTTQQVVVLNEVFKKVWSD